jgi:carbamate kinase
MRVVLAIGGNALLQSGDDGTVESQSARALESLSYILPLLISREKLLLTHGNGPQVGNALLRAEAGIPQTPPRPLDYLVSDTQGGIGYLLERTLRNLIRKNESEREVMTMLAQVKVESDDPSFDNPSKPIGPWFSLDEKQNLEEKGWVLTQTEKGVRRLVPSPKPTEVIELETIRSLFENRMLCVTAGGGGTPVIQNSEGWQGVEGVIDKDLVSGILATRLNATHLVIATDVENVWVGPKRKPLGHIDTTTLRQYHDNSEFPSGSMGPKVSAALGFVRSKNQTAIITSLSKVMEAFEGNTGTIVTY